MATVVYLHGFASVGKSAKSDRLAETVERLGHRFAAPDLPVDPEDVIKTVFSTVDNLTNGREESAWPLVFVGTSLGGFWARYFSARYDTPCVLVNPATSPTKTMSDRLDKALTNYKTGESITVTRETLEKFLVAETYAKYNGNGALLNLFVAMDDEVLNPIEMIEDLPFYESRTVTEDGGHRFEAHWDKVIEKTLEIIEKN